MVSVLKPDIFDGSVPLREFLTQFNLIACANNWGNAEKVVVLTSCLRGKVQSVLEEGTELENSQFDDLVSRLELRFGKKFLAQTYMQFINRKFFGSDLERLSRLAYPECSPGLQDKIACSQIIVALTKGNIKQILQLEEFTFLRVHIFKGCR
ncbi:hypothetical protein P5V15_001337 [Pogonomyrmex californicus]